MSIIKLENRWHRGEVTEANAHCRGTKQFLEGGSMGAALIRFLVAAMLHKKSPGTGGAGAFGFHVWGERNQAMTREGHRKPVT
jgi:hypothetical protein